MSDKQSLKRFLRATRELARDLDQLNFGDLVAFVYNPLIYAWNAHEAYLTSYLPGRKRVIFIGMNPGPFGMAQTGVPFGEVAAVRDWLNIQARVERPAIEHPGKPVLGFDCPRSEVSGRRLWGLFAREFKTPREFFAGHFVYNYCPLLFLDRGKTGRNLTPETLSGPAVREMLNLCDRHLVRLVEHCGCEWVVGVGNFAERRLQTVFGTNGPNVGKILHPSPASPAANRDWDGQVKRTLQQLGIWHDLRS